MNVLGAFRHIKAFVLDVDGVLTDSTILVLDDGQQVRRMNIKDGYAMQLAIKKGYHILVLSGGSSSGVRTRLERLGITNIHLEVNDKKELLQQFIAKQGLQKENVLFMGDDIPDLDAMQVAGLACCPEDAVPEIKAVAHYISFARGGKGCVRDIIEKVLKLNGDWSHVSGVAAR